MHIYKYLTGAGDVVKDQEEAALVAPRLPQRDDIGVAEGAQEGHLPLSGLPHLR